MTISLDDLKHLSFNKVEGSGVIHNTDDLFTEAEYKTARHRFTLLSDPAHLKVLEMLDPCIVNGPWIGGGSPLAWVQGKESKSDIDVWFRTEFQFQRAKQLFSATTAVVSATKKKKKYSPDRPLFEIVTESSNAITFKAKLDRGTKPKPPRMTDKPVIVQLIRREFYNKPEHIIDEFDFSVCQLISDGHTLLAGPTTYKDIKDKRLRIISYRPDSFISRYTKYVNYGYVPDPDVLERICDDPDLIYKYEEGAGY